MENQSNPRTNTIQGSIDRIQLLVIDDNTSLNYYNLSKNIIKESYDALYVTSLFKVEIRVLEKHLVIKLYGNDFFETLTLPKNKNLFIRSLYLQIDYIKLQFSLKLLQQKNYKLSRTKTTNINHLNKINTFIHKSPQFKENTKIKQILNIKKIINKLINHCTTIDDLPKELLKLKHFENYQFCQILFHEKGSTIGENIIYNESLGAKTAKIPIPIFNRIHSIIKNSKSKQFNQTQILEKFLYVSGTFLGRQINLKKHNIIIIISRNDFLSSSNEEQKYFQTLLHHLTPLVNKLLEEYLLQKKNIYLDTIFENINCPILIVNKDNNKFYENISFQKSSFNHRNFLDFSEKIDLSNNYSLIYNNKTDDLGTSDIYHFQRISLLGELLNTLRHELNNPLFGIKLTTNLILDEDYSPDIREILHNISLSCDRGQKIIHNFSYLYSNKELFQNINLHSILQEIMILTKSETRGIEKEINFANNIDPNTFILETNPTWITQIIFNFVVNSAQALKSIQDKVKNLKIEISVSVNSNKTITISVSDNGPGIPNHLVNHIMSPFITTKKTGTGLGLSICNFLAKKLNSTIQYKNNSSFPGATFSIQLEKSTGIN